MGDVLRAPNSICVSLANHPIKAPRVAGAFQCLNHYHRVNYNSAIRCCMYNTGSAQYSFSSIINMQVNKFVGSQTIHVELRVRYGSIASYPNNLECHRSPFPSNTLTTIHLWLFIPWYECSHGWQPSSTVALSTSEFLALATNLLTLELSRSRNKEYTLPASKYRTSQSARKPLCRQPYFCGNSPTANSELAVRLSVRIVGYGLSRRQARNEEGERGQIGLHRLKSQDFVRSVNSTAGWDSLYRGKRTANEESSCCYANNIRAQHCL